MENIYKERVKEINRILHPGKMNEEYVKALAKGVKINKYLLANLVLDLVGLDQEKQSKLEKLGVM